MEKKSRERTFNNKKKSLSLLIFKNLPWIIEYVFLINSNVDVEEEIFEWHKINLINIISEKKTVLLINIYSSIVCYNLKN